MTNTPVNIPVKTLVSIGHSCQSAHQLARFAQQYPDQVAFKKGPFDWLICSPEAACSWLESGLEDFQPDEITNHRDHAYWAKHKFWFWHGFIEKTEGAPYLDIAGTMQREYSKLAHQRRMFETLDPQSTVFVTSNTQNNLEDEVYRPDEADRFFFTDKHFDQLKDALSRYFQSEVDLKLISRPDRISNPLTNHPDVRLLEPEPSQWKGSDENWDKALKSLI